MNKKGTIKRIFFFSMISVFALILSLTFLTKDVKATEVTWDGTADTIAITDAITAGKGTINDPVLIESAEAFAGLASLVNVGNTYSGKYFKLTVDMKMNDKTALEMKALVDANDVSSLKKWTPLGDNNTSYRYFYGNIDGDNHIISGIYVNSYMGGGTLGAVFGYMCGEISNFIFKDSYIRSGGAAGMMFECIGTANNCSFDGIIESTGTIGGGNPVGGLAAMGYGTIQNSANFADINILNQTSYLYIGGILGNGSVKISNSFNHGNINYNFHSTSAGTRAYVGGIAGGLTIDGKIANCYNSGEINPDFSAETTGAGSIAGYADSTAINNITYAFYLTRREFNNTFGAIGNVSLTNEQIRTQFIYSFDSSDRFQVGGVSDVVTKTYKDKASKNYDEEYSFAFNYFYDLMNFWAAVQNGNLGTKQYSFFAVTHISNPAAFTNKTYHYLAWDRNDATSGYYSNYTNMLVEEGKAYDFTPDTGADANYAPTKYGYTFKGWVVNDTTKDRDYNNSTNPGTYSFTVSKNTVVNAVWQLNTFAQTEFMFNNSKTSFTVTYNGTDYELSTDFTHAVSASGSYIDQITSALQWEKYDEEDSTWKSISGATSKTYKIKNASSTGKYRLKVVYTVTEKIYGTTQQVGNQSFTYYIGGENGEQITINPKEIYTSLGDNALTHVYRGIDTINTTTYNVKQAIDQKGITGYVKFSPAAFGSDSLSPSYRVVDDGATVGSYSVMVTLDNTNYVIYGSNTNKEQAFTYIITPREILITPISKTIVFGSKDDQVDFTVEDKDGSTTPKYLIDEIKDEDNYYSFTRDNSSKFDAGTYQIRETSGIASNYPNYSITTDCVGILLTISSKELTYGEKGNATFTLDSKAPKDFSIVYTGKALSPNTVVLNVVGFTDALTAADYTISYSDNIEPSAKATITITGKGNFSGTISDTFTISKVSKSDVTISNNPVLSAIYYGQELGNTIITAGTITYQGKTVVGTYEIVDPKIVFNTSSAALQTVEVKFVPESTEYFNDMLLNVSITLKYIEITFAFATVSKQAIAYNGTATKPATNPTKTGYTFDNWYDKAEDGTVFNFTTPITSDTTIYAYWTLKVASGSFLLNGNAVAQVTYNGANQVLSFEASHDLGNIGLSYAWYKELVVEDNKIGTGQAINLLNVADSGKYIVEVTYTDSNLNTSKKEFDCLVTINECDIATLSFDALVDVTYNANEYTPTAVVKHGAAMLIEGTHYRLEYDANKDAGTASVIVIALDDTNYTGSKTLNFTINNATITDIILDTIVEIYDGTAKNSALASYTTQYGDDILDADIVYTYSLNGNIVVNPINANIYNVVAVINLTNYNQLTLNGTLEIEKAGALELPGVTFDDQTKTYDNKALTISINDESLLPDGISVQYYINDELITSVIATGIYAVTAKFSYSLELANNFDSIEPMVATYSIIGVSIGEITLSSITPQNYTASEITPDIGTLSMSFLGEDYTLVIDEDYEIEYTNNQNAGTATVTVKGIGNFSGSTSTEFIINKANITVTPNANQSKIYGNSDNITYTITSGELLGSDKLTGSLTKGNVENVGEYTILIGTLNNTNYEITLVLETYEIKKLAITVTAHNLSKTYGDADPILTFGHDLLPFDDKLTGSLAREVGENALDYIINIGTLANPNYDITFVTGIFTINKKDITVVADNNQSKLYDREDPVLTYMVTDAGLVNDDTLDGLLSRESGEGVGTYAITQGTLANPNYEITFVGSPFTVLIATPEVSAVPVLSTIYFGQKYGAANISGGIVFGYNNVVLEGDYELLFKDSVLYESSETQTTTVKFTPKNQNYQQINITVELSGKYIDVTYTTVDLSITEDRYLYNDLIKNMNLERAGFQLVGWYLDEQLTNEWDFDSNRLVGPITLHAKYELLNKEVSITIEETAGKTVILHANIDKIATAEYSYQWQKNVDGNWVDVKGANSSALRISNHSDSGLYRVVVTIKDNFGEATLDASAAAVDIYVKQSTWLVWTLFSISVVAVLGFVLYRLLFHKYLLNKGSKQ